LLPRGTFILTSEGNKIKRVRDRIALLSTLNVLQPMTAEEIVSGLSQHLSIDNAGDVLHSLMDDGLVRKNSEDKYVVSQRWLKTSGISSLRKARDKQRLLYLANRSRRG
jgi:hypothetical protein